MEIQEGNTLQSIDKTLAIVILNYNGIYWIEKFINNILNYSKNYPVYIIDNASTDNSVTYIKENFPEINIIYNDKNYGYAEGYNQGLKKIQADIFCLLNSDVEVSENWILPIIKLFNSDPLISVIQPKILDYNKKEYFEFAGAAGGFLDNFGYPYCQGRIFWTLEKDDLQYSTSEIFWGSGSCFFIRKKDFHEMKGFDEVFFAHMEEIDLCWRLKNSGKKIYYCSESTIYHVGGGTLDSSNPKKTYLNFRNNLLMLYKNLPKKRFFLIIFIRLCLDGAAGILFLLKRGPSHFWAIILAHFSFYRLVINKKIDKKPGKVKYYFYKNIIFQYFIFGRKKFTDLK